jgi:integrase
MTIAEYLVQWLDNAVEQSPKTLERYRQLLRLQITPHIGDVPLQKLKPEHVSEWHGKLIASGLSPRTVLHAHRLLSLGLKRAAENGTIVRNVATIRRPPKVEDPEIETLSAEQITAVLTGLANHYLGPIATLALTTGMRRGELLALQWADINLDRGVLRVERSLEETKAGLRIRPPKSKRGRRNLTLPPEAIDMLREHRKHQIEVRLALGQGGQPSLVFSTIEGEHLSPDNLSRDWRRVCRARKLPLVSFHSLRHTHASILLGKGVPVLAVSRRLGHAKASVTLDTYGHLMEGADAAAAKAIEGVLK